MWRGTLGFFSLSVWNMEAHHMTTCDFAMSMANGGLRTHKYVLLSNGTALIKIPLRISPSPYVFCPKFFIKDFFIHYPYLLGVWIAEALVVGESRAAGIVRGLSVGLGSCQPLITLSLSRIWGGCHARCSQRYKLSLLFCKCMIRGLLKRYTVHSGPLRQMHIGDGRFLKMTLKTNAHGTCSYSFMAWCNDVQ